MSHATSNTPAPNPSLAELMANYLRRPPAPPAPLGEVEPYDAAPVQPVDARLAWDEAGAVLRYFPPAAAGAPVPADWAALVSIHEPAVALAFAAGNFPQLVRTLQPLLHLATDLRGLRPRGGHALHAPSLVEWAQRTVAASSPPQTLLALGVLRLARQFDVAEEGFRKHQAKVPAAWQAAWANEEAALAWHRGDADKAEALWQRQPENTPVLLNRGMAALFRNARDEARPLLTRAAAAIPETSAWHHLGRLYLTLADSTGG